MMDINSMYDLNKEFKSFYKNHVVLSREKKDQLKEARNLNIDRLVAGLKDYNEEKNKDIKLLENIIQGSVAMSTVCQNESSSYDIDIAIVIDKEKLPDGTIASKNIIRDALTKKTQQFKVTPEVKTNCVRVSYQEGYHVDFAIYRRSKDVFGNFRYEHCGSEWRERNPESISDWFVESDKEKNNQLRMAVRLLKMFCKSRSKWNMPGGLVQSVLLDECLFVNERIDVMFYNSLVALRNRLMTNKEVHNPTNKLQSLKLIAEDDVRLINLETRLNTYIKRLDVLFNEDCAYNQAIKAWTDFFDHDFWEIKISEHENLRKSSISGVSNLDTSPFDGEEFIENIYNVNLIYDLEIDCIISQNGFRDEKLTTILKNQSWLFPRKRLSFFIKKINVPKPYKVFWKVKNIGDEAIKRNMTRGEIFEMNSDEKRIEHSIFKGEHFVECYIVKDNVCVAKSRINVPIISNA